MLKNPVDRLQLFSAREILLSEADHIDTLRCCVSAAKKFLDAASIADVLDVLFEQEANRRCVLDSVQGIFHVGFLVEKRPQTIDWLKMFSREVGLASGHVVCESTIISRELGQITRQQAVPTTIFKAFEHEARPSNYIEVFMPNDAGEIVVDWIKQEVGTHIGFTLTDPSLLVNVQESFLAEGFEIPAFMEGRAMTNAAVGGSAIYFDKSHSGRTVRIELWNRAACT